jgi:outer membrane lipoprotein-sorting protein
MRIFVVVLSLFVALSGHALEAAAQEAAPDKNITAHSADIKKIEKYLNGITTLVMSFEQEDSEGGRASGNFYLQRPGHLRWDYDPPAPILIVAKGSMVAYYDKELNEVSHISLDDTMAGFLTRQRISFGDEGVKITAFEKGKNTAILTIMQDKKEDQGSLTMHFKGENMDLVRMEVVDSIGKKTIVQFGAPEYGKAIDKELFALPRKQSRKRN